jgi:hypothetical protein
MCVPVLRSLHLPAFSSRLAALKFLDCTPTIVVDDVDRCFIELAMVVEDEVEVFEHLLE